MKSHNRFWGQNLSVYMKQKGMSVSDIASKTGYSEEEIKRIIESRLFINSSEKEAFAKTLSVSTEDFSKVPSDKELEESGYMECRGKFSSTNNREKILDMFDAYCDIQELVLHARETNDIR